jgi:ketosteroid isomerase-like protein
MYVGHQAIRQTLQTWLADTVEFETSSGTIDAVEVAASGDLAYARGSGRFSQNTPSGLVECSEKWVAVYRKMDGRWKIIVDIINNDKLVSGK